MMSSIAKFEVAEKGFRTCKASSLSSNASLIICKVNYLFQNIPRFSHKIYPMRRYFFAALTILLTLLAASAQDPSATRYDRLDCSGTFRPYPNPERRVATPDSLTPVFINHVGRHGARFPSSDKNALELQRALLKADSLGTITAEGRQLLKLTNGVISQCTGRWGALDSLGMAEQRAIASRMYQTFPSLFAGGRVDALSSYVPRCVMSMYEFTHQLMRLNNKIEIYTSAGRQNNPLMRPWENDRAFQAYLKGKVWETPYNDYMAATLSTAPIKRVLGENYPLTKPDALKLTMAEYYVIAGFPSMGHMVDSAPFFTLEEYNACWGVFNLKHYLERSANTLSTEPADVASKLLLDIIDTTDDAVSGRADITVALRFGHAETILPLISLMRLRGGYYMTNYFDTVGLHWRDFDLSPMAANLQLILFKNKSGKYYVRLDLNERPIPILPNDDRLYLPWGEARDYFIRCLPLIDQP